jgi:hypothetical protein
MSAVKKDSVTKIFFCLLVYCVTTRETSVVHDEGLAYV